MTPLRAVLHSLVGRAESEDLYRLVVEHSPYCIHRIDLEGRLSAMNPAGLVMMGVPREDDVVGLPYLEAVCDEDRSRIAGLLEKALQGAESEFEFSAANGLRFSSNFVPIRDEKGEIVSLMGITQDISQRIEVAGQLHRSEERLQLALAAAALGAWEIDPADGGMQWFGLGSVPHQDPTPTETLSQYSETVQPADRDRFDATLRAAMLTPTQFVTRFHVGPADADTRHIEWSGRSIADATGRVDRVVGTIKDITEQTEQESRLWQLQKLESLGVMAGGIAHDFNNLLVSIMGNIDLAILDLGASSSAAEILNDALRGSERAADLCRQMLAYSGRAPFLIDVVDLSRTVRDMTDLLHVAVNNSVLAMELEEGATWVRGDVTQIRQVLMNLVINAAEASSASGGRVGVRTLRCPRPPLELGETRLGAELPEGAYVLLEVDDDGVGMDRETTARMFDPFFTSKKTGRGLGLSAVLGIVQSHGGALGVRSLVGKGTRVRFWLPITPHGAPESVVDTSPESNPGHGRTALIVDDEPSVRALAVRVVEHAGWRTVVAGSGEEALSLAVAMAPGRIDVALVDLTMPGMGGVEVARALRSHDPSMAIVLTSGFSEEDADASLRTRVADAFLPKPYLAAELVRIVDSAASHVRL